MAETREERLHYYATPGPFTELSRHAERLRDLPRRVPELCAVVQGLVLHPHHAFRYGVAVPDDRQPELQIRKAGEMIDRIVALDGSDLAKARPPERRVVGNCRHFTTLLCALLRHQDVPARGRCGFGAYFEPGRFVDHWVAERWDAGEERFVLCDAQLDDVQREGMKLALDPQDVTRDEFLVAGDAWQRCRRGEADPKRFGIFDMWGRWFVLGNVVRDIASLAKRELLPWDGWGMMTTDDAKLGPADLAFVDRVAAVETAADPTLAEILPLAEGDPRLRVPRVVMAFVPKPHEIDLGID
jgi:Transglutaminase-like superfamily